MAKVLKDLDSEKSEDKRNKKQLKDGLDSLDQDINEEMSKPIRSNPTISTNNPNFYRH